MAKLTLTDLANLQNESTATAALTANNTLIEAAIENTLSRDGTSPNSMNADFDMNSNRILNLPAPATDTEPLRLGDLPDILPTIISQTTAPDTTYTEGTLWIDSDSTDLDLYQLNSTPAWVDTTVNLKGATGATGETGAAGTNGTDGIDGEMAGPGVSVDSEIALFDGITGATLKRATTTGILKGTSGVLSAAVSATDYAPATTGSSILKASSGGFASAVAGTDYAAATTGSSLLKADGAGGFATPGTSDVLTIGTIELGAAADTTLSRTGAGAIAVEGVGVALNSTSLVHTASTIELGHATDTTLSRASAGVLAVEGVNVLTTGTGIAQGTHTMMLMAPMWVPRTTNGAQVSNYETTTNDIVLRVYDFDTTTSEGVGIMLPMPDSWNEGTITFIPYWTAASGSGTVIWSMSGRAFANDAAFDQALGTAQTSTDTLITALDCHIGPESSAITIAGSPAAGDLVYLQLTRDVSDTLGVDAKLIAVKVKLTINGSTD